jgi:dipeptidase
MDLVRLALERASTAGEAVEVIAGLLRHYGQAAQMG